MRAKEFLLSVRSNKAQIESLIERRDYYESLAQRVTASYGERMGTTAHVGNSSVEANIMKALEIQEDIEKQLDVFTTRVKDVERVLKMLGDDETERMLRWRYFNGWSWRKIENGLHYARNTLWMKHVKALERIDKILEEGEHGADAAEADG